MSSPTSTSTTNEESSSTEYVNLSARKRIAVREYKGHKFVDIREFYTDKESGEWKPGKKGITLNKQEVEKLKGLLEYVSQHLA